jgi:hypothetical protein
MRGTDKRDDARQENGDESYLTKSDWDRRSVLKASAAAGTGLIGTTAGCTSSSDEGGDSSDDSDDSGGSSSGSQSTKDTVQLILAPTGFQAIIMDYLNSDTDIYSNSFNDADLEVEVAKSWEGAAIFTSGGADFGTLGSLEAAQLAGERDLPLAVNANMAPQFMNINCAIDGAYDPDNTGSPQASMDKLAETQDRFALGGWGGGTGIMMPMIVDKAFDYSFTPDESSDFDITTAEYFAIPQLINDGSAVMGTSSPLHGAANAMAPAEYTGEEPTIKQAWNTGAIMEATEGFAAPQLNSWTCSKEYADDIPASPETVVQTFQTGIDWFYDDPIGRMESDEEHLKQLNLESLDIGRYVMDWGINLNFDNELPVLYSDIGLDDEFIEKDKRFLGSAQDTGFLSEGWEENLEYRKVQT